MKDTFRVLNEMCVDGVIGTYAIGGAVGATFYLEPFATLDLDVFILFGTATSPATQPRANQSTNTCFRAATRRRANIS